MPFPPYARVVCVNALQAIDTYGEDALFGRLSIELRRSIDKQQTTAATQYQTPDNFAQGLHRSDSCSSSSSSDAEEEDISDRSGGVLHTFFLNPDAAPLEQRGNHSGRPLGEGKESTGSREATARGSAANKGASMMCHSNPTYRRSNSSNSLCGEVTEYCTPRHSDDEEPAQQNGGRRRASSVAKASGSTSAAAAPIANSRSAGKGSPSKEHSPAAAVVDYE